MFGLDRHAGKPISGVAHLRQSIEDILTTRVMLRDYASGLQELVDDPINGTLKVEAFARPGRKPGIDGRACALRSAPMKTAACTKAASSDPWPQVR